jgi:hypothetical protein
LDRRFHNEQTGAAGAIMYSPTYDHALPMSGPALQSLFASQRRRRGGIWCQRPGKIRAAGAGDG